MSGKKIVIAGAGISGLAAARLLLIAGYQVKILEARERAGGRILTLRQENYFVEAGPEFIHGRLAGTLALLKAYGIGYAETKGRSYRLSGEQQLSASEEDPEGWDEMLAEMASLPADITLAEFLRSRFPGEKWEELRAQARGFAAGFDLADPEKVSARSLAGEWQTENGPQFRLMTGYGTLIESLRKEILERGGQIHFNMPLEKLDWKPGSVACYSGLRMIAEGDMALLTLPVAVIQHHAAPERLLPGLPDKIQAAKEIGVGIVIKMVIEFSEPFWAEAAPEALFFFGGAPVPTWWTNRPLEGNQLTGWLGGPEAVKYSGRPQEELLNMALDSLADFSGLTRGKLRDLTKAWYIFDWAGEPLTGGAYTYTLAGSPTARARWATPVAGTLFFAGEACHEGAMIGTVEAAVLSAAAAVEAITASQH